jgi:predicted enzyme related to lactoylglutathione lyase
VRVALDFAGAVLDVAVTDLDRAEAFYARVVGRACDLRPQPDQCEWRLHREPEVALRLTAEEPGAQAGGAGRGRLALGVADLEWERTRLSRDWPDLPAATVKPGIIALLRFPDPDGNVVTLWQDLMGAARR